MMPEYRSMLIASQCLRWGAMGLGGFYLLSRVIGGYARMYSDNFNEVASVATTEGFILYIFETIFMIVLLGVVYTIGESVAALRDIARNSFRQDTVPRDGRILTPGKPEPRASKKYVIN